jgi:hypothetical protein
MTYKEAVNKMGWKVAIHEDRKSEKVVAFDNSGWGMSKRWWRETYRADQDGSLWGVYQTPTGLRRIVR